MRRTLSAIALTLAMSVTPAAAQNHMLTGSLAMVCSELPQTFFSGICNGFIEGVRQSVVLFGYACVPEHLTPTDLSRVMLPSLKDPGWEFDDAVLLVSTYLHLQYPCEASAP